MQKELSVNNLLFVIKKYQKTGFESLSLSDLALAVSVPEFRDHFIRNTGQDWATKYELKALQKLQDAHFDMQWMIQQEESSLKPFFSSCIKGDIQHVKDIMRRQDIDLLKNAVDRSKKTALHVAAEQGHSVLAEFLINQGFNPNARDKLLKTPLHYSCNKGNEYIFSVLLQNGADLSATDSYNRSALHYACCGPSSIIVNQILGQSQNQANSVDNNQLSPLHYLMLNSSSKQVEIIRSLLEKGANVNQRDSEGKTALFHAAYQGKSRVIPILLKNKADINISDYENLQTPLDVAANQRTRELLIVYSQSENDPQPKKEDLQWMNAAVKGEKVQKEDNLFAPPKLEGNFTGGNTQETQQKFGKTQSDLKNQMETQQNYYHNKTQNQQNDITLTQTLNQQKDTMSNLSRERFFQMMKKIQDEGVKAYQHIKKPYIYTGSWMEGVQSLGDLYTVMQEIQPSEAVLCVFNLLCPYDKPLPQDDGQEAIDGFYGDPWKQAIKSPLEDKLEREKKIQAQLTNMEQIKKKLREKEKALTDQIYESKELTKDNESLRSQLEKLQQQANQASIPQDIQDQLSGKEAEMIKMKKTVAQLKQELKEKQLVIEELEKREEQEENQEENAQNIEKIIHLEEELRIEKQKNKMQRFKSGQLFLKTLSQGGVKKSKQGGGNYNQDNLQDDDAIIRMFNALKDNPPNFIQRLQIVDKNGDNKVNVHEFIEFCSKLKLSQQDIMSLQRIVGFQDGRKLLGIQEFQKILQQRPQERQEAEERLFKKIIDAFQAKNKTIEEVFQEIDTDGSGDISSSEFRVGLEKLKIILNQKDLNNIFCIFDKDKSNSISLGEMKETINMYKQKLEGKFLDDQEQPQEEEKEQKIDYERISQEENYQLLGEGKDINKDETQLNGELKVQIPRIRKFFTNLNLVSFEITLNGLNHDTIIDQKQIGDKGDLFYAFKLQIVQQKPEELADYLKIRIYKENIIDEQHYLGEIQVAWKACVLNPGEYFISKEFTVCNLSYPEKDPKGYLGLQARYTPIAARRPKQNLEIEDPEFPQQLVPPKEFSPITRDNIEAADEQESTANYKQKQLYQSKNLTKKSQKTTSIKPMEISDKELELMLNEKKVNQNDLVYLENLDSDISGYVQQTPKQNQQNYKQQQQQQFIDDSNIEEVLGQSDFMDLSNTQLKELDSNVSEILYK